MVKSKVNFLEFNSWKQELAMLSFSWLAASQEECDRKVTRMPTKEAERYKTILKDSALVLARIFTFSGAASTNLQLAQEHDGPVIVVRSIFPEIPDKPNTVKSPDDLLRLAEKRIKELGVDEFSQGVLKAPLFHLSELRKRWFCQHDWIESQYPEDEGVPLEVCEKCGMEKLKILST